ncbi:STAS domain-containing protein [Gynuella sp.]|uniref:STAS domain-containing protein n=1 Tax=Gynuella sp. TaxID=2969146 RepID=UPI003D0AAB0B
MFEYAFKEDHCQAAISGEMTIYTILELKEKIAAMLADAHNITLDLSAVNEIDSAGIQLLLVLHNNRLKHQYSLTLTHPHDCVTDAFATLGLQSYLSQSES